MGFWCLSHPLFVLMLKVPVNRQGLAGTVSLPNHTFFLGKLDNTLLVTDNKPSWVSGIKDNGRKNYFTIYLQESMGPGRD